MCVLISISSGRIIAAVFRTVYGACTVALRTNCCYRCSLRLRCETAQWFCALLPVTTPAQTSQRDPTFTFTTSLPGGAVAVPGRSAC